MKPAGSLEEAVRRVQALINVLDEDLRVPSPPIPTPENISHLRGQAAADARSALRFLAHSVDEMERYVAEARQAADDWRRRSSAAWDSGHYFLAAQARQRIVEMERDLHLYEEEVAAACQLLRQCNNAEIDWTKR
jgi:hypothetical protein